MFFIFISQVGFVGSYKEDFHASVTQKVVLKAEKSHPALLQFYGFVRE